MGNKGLAIIGTGGLANEDGRETSRHERSDLVPGTIWTETIGPRSGLPGTGQGVGCVDHAGTPCWGWNPGDRVSGRQPIGDPGAALQSRKVAAGGAVACGGDAAMVCLWELRVGV